MNKVNCNINKVNCNINKIILQYIDYSKDNLKRIIPNISNYKYFYLNPNLSCLDIIVKCLQTGHKGFYISNDHKRLIKTIKKLAMNDDDIVIENDGSDTCVGIDINKFTSDGKQITLHYCNIFTLNNVLYKKDIKENIG
jgi:hypothetical protein